VGVLTGIEFAIQNKLIAAKYLNENDVTDIAKS
jgi:hypothetical protein